MNARVYCSEASAGQQMLGTAEEVDIWLLLEYRPAWRAKALTDNHLAAPIRSWLMQGIGALEAQGRKVRPQFIRQPERERAAPCLMIHQRGELRAFSADGAGYGGLTETPLAVLAAGAGGTPLRAPHYFVCTNGQRDLCCARFGLPVYNRLREHVGKRAWQITHLGGHRFAPNVLVLPQGALYGRVPAGEGAEGAKALAAFVGQVEAGALSLEHLRGRSYYPKPVQAAEGFAGTGLEFVAMEGDERKARVTFTRQGKLFRLSVAQASKPVCFLPSCGDEQHKEAYPYTRVE